MSKQLDVLDLMLVGGAIRVAAERYETLQQEFERARPYGSSLPPPSARDLAEYVMQELDRAGFSIVPSDQVK